MNITVCGVKELYEITEQCIPEGELQYIILYI